MTEIVTVRIDEETKRKVKRYGVSISEVARGAILKEIERREHEETIQALRRMKSIMRKVDVKKVVEDLREDKASR